MGETIKAMEIILFYLLSDSLSCHTDSIERDLCNIENT